MIIYIKSIFPNLIFMFKIKKLSNFILHDAGIKKAFLLAALILSNGACSFNPGSLDSLTWKVDLLGPLVKTELVLEDFLEFQDISLPLVIDMGLGDTTIDCPPPPIGCISLPPVIIPSDTNTFPTIAAFESITFETVDIFMVITNNSPLTIKTGGKLTVTDGSAVPVVELTVDSDILKGTSYTTSISSFQNKVVKNSLTLSIENFTTDSISLPVTFTSSDNIKIEFKIQVIKISSVVANPITFTISDTTDFNLEGDFLETNIEEGEIIAFINNEIPFEIKLQAYFLGADKSTVLDSLFVTNEFINASDSSRISVPFSENKFQEISSAKYVNIYAQFSILPGTQLERTISKDQKIEFLMVGDFKIKLN